MNKHVFVVFVVGALALGCQRAIPAGPYVSREGSFSVDLPLPAKESSRRVDSVSGSLKSHILTATDGRERYFNVAFLDAPGLGEFSPRQALDMMWDANRKLLDGEFDIRIVGSGGLIGIEFFGELPNGIKNADVFGMETRHLPDEFHRSPLRVVGRLMLARNRYYLVQGIVRQGGSLEEGRKFVSSFQYKE